MSFHDAHAFAFSLATTLMAVIRKLDARVFMLRLGKADIL